MRYGRYASARANSSPFHSICTQMIDRFPRQVRLVVLGMALSPKDNVKNTQTAALRTQIAAHVAEAQRNGELLQVVSAAPSRPHISAVHLGWISGAPARAGRLRGRREYASAPTAGIFRGHEARGDAAPRCGAER